MYGALINNLELSEYPSYSVIDSGNNVAGKYDYDYGEYCVVWTNKNYVSPDLLIAIRPVDSDTFYGPPGGISYYPTGYWLEYYQAGLTVTLLRTNSAATVYDYRVAKAGVFSPATGHGLALYDANGEITFNSNDPLMIIAAKIEILVDANTTDSVATYTVTNPMNLPLFLVAPGQGMASVSINSTQQKYIQTSIKVINPTTVQVSVFVQIVNFVSSITSAYIKYTLAVFP